MKSPAQTLRHAYPPVIWVLGLAVLGWSVWLAYQQVNRAVFNPADASGGLVNARQHKLNAAAYDKVMAAWQQKKAAAETDEPLVNPFTKQP